MCYVNQREVKRDRRAIRSKAQSLGLAELLAEGQWQHRFEDDEWWATAPDKINDPLFSEEGWQQQFVIELPKALALQFFATAVKGNEPPSRAEADPSDRRVRRGRK